MYKYIVVPVTRDAFISRIWSDVPITALLLLEQTAQYLTFSEYGELYSLKHPIGWPRLSDYTPCKYCTYDNEFVLKNLLFFNTLQELESFILYKTL